MSVRIAVCTISDTRTADNDTSGGYLIKALHESGHELIEYSIIPDDLDSIIQTFKDLGKRKDVDVILSTGGTGITARDVTPEAVEAVCEKSIPGFGELFRMMSFQNIGTSTIQSRACAGVFSGTLLFALPGSTGACKDAWTFILEQQLDVNHKPCNFVQVLHRLDGAKRESPVSK